MERARNYRCSVNTKEYLDGVYNNHPGGKVTAWNDLWLTYVQRKKSKQMRLSLLPTQTFTSKQRELWLSNGKVNCRAPDSVR